MRGQKISDILAKVVSYAFHPLWITSYATLFVSWKLFFTTLVFTALLPLANTIVYIKNIHASLTIPDRKQRTIPYLITIACYLLWSNFVNRYFALPPILKSIMLGMILTLIIIAAVNFWWKISAHMASIAGLISACLALQYHTGVTYILALTVLYSLAIVICWARTKLDAHTPEQLAVGFLVGLTTIFVTAIII